MKKPSQNWCLMMNADNEAGPVQTIDCERQDHLTAEEVSNVRDTEENDDDDDDDDVR
jgi:hypothetical protein